MFDYAKVSLSETMAYALELSIIFTICLSGERTEKKVIINRTSSSVLFM